MKKLLLLLVLFIPLLLANAPFESPNARGWNTVMGQNSPGYCMWQDGYGWDGQLSNPSQLPVNVHTDRQFSPGHLAIDINMPLNTPVYAAEDGIVVWAGSSALGGGNMVKISHGDWWYTTYIHLNEVLVECGQLIETGQLVGFSGHSGTSWDHLHFAVFRGPTAQDPCFYLGCRTLEQRKWTITPATGKNPLPRNR